MSNKKSKGSAGGEQYIGYPCLNPVFTEAEPLIIPDEFKDILKVLDMGAVKYGANSWLKGNHFDIHKNHRSMSHHLLESYREIREDHESGLDPLLHLATRALMEYTLRSRGLIDENGQVKKNEK